MDNKKAVFVLKSSNTNNSLLNEAIALAINALEEVEKHEETFEWCTGCKEYCSNTHSCPRWNKVISRTVEEIKQGYAIVNCRECIYRNTKDCPVNGDFIERNPWFYCGMGEKHEKTGT